MSVSPPTSNLLPITERVNTEIRVGMARRNVKAQDIAGQLDLSYQSFWRRMSGEVSWNLAELEVVATALGLDDVGDLFR